MAVRAEYAGIGIYGNRTVAPGVDAAEFGAAISRLLSPTEEAANFAHNAEMGELCRQTPGKKGVVGKIFEIAGNGDFGTVVEETERFLPGISRN